MIIIERQQLVKYDAPPDMVAWFDKHFPDGRAEFDDARALFLSAMENGGARHAAWWADRADVSLRLRSADLSGCDLRGVDIEGADLFCANMQGANLSYANLTEARLRYADLRGTNLTGVCILGADLHGARRLDTDPPIPGWVVKKGGLQRE